MKKFLYFFRPMPPHSALFFEKAGIALLAMFALLAALQLAPRRSRKGIIAFATFLGGLYYVTEFFYPVKPGHDGNFLTPYQDFVTNTSTVVGAFAIGLGIFSLVQLHSRNVVKLRPGWGNSVMLLVSFVAMLVFGLWNDASPNHRLFHSHVTVADVFSFLFNGGLTNLGSATFSMIAFFIASASYRAFRIKSREATFLMIAALIVMLGSVSFGTALTNRIPFHTPSGAENPWANLRIENIAQWLLMEVNSAAQRGILFGLTLGSLAMALRLWLSLERGSYFEKEL